MLMEFLRKFIKIEWVVVSDKDHSCSRKVKFNHKETADSAISAMKNKRRLLESYKCRYCDGWHIGGKW